MASLQDTVRLRPRGPYETNRFLTRNVDPITAAERNKVMDNDIADGTSTAIGPRVPSVTELGSSKLIAPLIDPKC